MNIQGRFFQRRFFKKLALPPKMMVLILSKSSLSAATNKLWQSVTCHPLSRTTRILLTSLFKKSLTWLWLVSTSIKYFQKSANLTTTQARRAQSCLINMRSRSSYNRARSIHSQLRASFLQSCTKLVLQIWPPVAILLSRIQLVGTLRPTLWASCQILWLTGRRAKTFLSHKITSLVL